MAYVRARRVFSGVRARRSQTHRVMHASRKRPGHWSRSELVFKGDQTTRFCALCCRCLSHRLGEKERGEVENHYHHAHISKCEVVLKMVSPEQDQPVLKSGLLPRSRQVPVYVWSPVISQCSKTCGNGKWNTHFTQNLLCKLRSTEAWHLCRNPAGMVFLCGPPD